LSQLRYPEHWLDLVFWSPRDDMSSMQADRRGSERRVYLRHNDAISQLPKADLRAPGEPAI